MNNIVNNQFCTDNLKEKNPILFKNCASEISFFKLFMTTCNILQGEITEAISKINKLINKFFGILWRTIPDVIVYFLQGNNSFSLPDYFDFSAIHCFIFCRTSSIVFSPSERSITSIKRSISSSDAAREGFVQLYSSGASFTDDRFDSLSSELTGFTDFTKPSFLTTCKKACKLAASSISTNSVFIGRKYELFKGNKMQPKRNAPFSIFSWETHYSTCISALANLSWGNFILPNAIIAPAIIFWQNLLPFRQGMPCLYTPAINFPFPIPIFAFHCRILLPDFIAGSYYRTDKACLVSTPPKSIALFNSITPIHQNP